MKKLILILTFIFTLTIFGNDITEKRIQISGTARKEIIPDTAKIRLTINTNDENLETATKLNNATLEKYKTLLKELNINYDSINSIDFNTNKYYNYKNIILNKGQKEFETSLKIDVTSIDINLLEKLISILSKNNIYSMRKNKNNNYSFVISDKASTQKEAYQKALNNFEVIKTKLFENNIDSSILNLVGFNNQTINLEKTENKKFENYNVAHQLELNTHDFQNLGKIIDLAHILNIDTDNYIEYDIKNKLQLEDELYQNSYNIALNKAKIILNKTDLVLEKPIVITDNSTGTIKPYYSYFNKTYYYDKYYTTEENIKENNSSIISKLQEYNTTIIPKKQKIEKSIYIEFEIK